MSDAIAVENQSYATYIVKEDETCVKNPVLRAIQDRIFGPMQYFRGLENLSQQIKRSSTLHFYMRNQRNSDYVCFETTKPVSDTPFPHVDAF